MDTKPIRVLLIEDDPGDARLIREMLAEVEGEPFALECVERLAEGLARLSAGGVDAVLLDLSLPDSQGMATYTRTHAHAPRVPIVVMTGHADEALGMQLVEAGAQDYLIKGQVTGPLLARVLRHAIERKRADEALREKEEHYRTLIENLPDAVSFTALDGRKRYTSRSAAALFGFERAEDVIGLDALELVAPEDRARAMEEMQHLVNLGQGVSDEREYTFVRRDGSRFPGAIRVAVVTDPAGRPSGFINAIRDITERKRAEAETRRLYGLSKQQAQDLTVLNEMGNLFASTLETHALFRQLTRRCVEVFHVDSCLLRLIEDERLVVTESYFQTPEDKATVMRLLAETPLRVGEGIAGRVALTGKAEASGARPIEQATLPPFAEYLRKRHWLVVPLQVKEKVIGVLTLLTGEAGDPFTERERALAQAVANQAAIAIENARLFSETRAARDAVLNMLEDLDDTARQVKASEAQYRTVVENATELIWTRDSEGRVTFANRYAEQVTGYKLADWQGKDLASGVAPEDLSQARHVFLETLKGKAQSYPVRLYRADDSWLYLSVNTAPLYRDGEIVGTISFGRDVTEEERLRRETEQRLSELSALFAVSAALREAKTLGEMLPIILRSTVQVMQCDQGLLALVDRERGEVQVRATTPDQASLLGLRTRIGEGIAGRVVQTGRPMLPADLAGLDGPEFLRRLVHEPRAVICYPLKTAAEVVGTISLSAPLPREFSEGELKLLTAIADMAASAIHRAGLFEDLERRVHELATLFDVGKMVTATLRIEDVQEFIVRAAAQAVHADGSYLFLWTESEQRLVMQAAHGLAPDLVGQVKYRLGEGLAGWVFLEGKPANVPDVAADPRWKPEPDQERTHAAGRVISALVVPLRVGEKMLGVLGVVNKIGAPAPSAVLQAGFSASDESLLTTLAGQVAIAIENARLYEDVRGLSTATIRSLATAIDARDPYTRGHSEEVTRLAVQAARELGWSGADLEMLEFAALLHDVGKIAVPDAILHKAGPLTPDEWDIIRLHPYHSAQIIKPVEALRRIVAWVYHHQEKWDGTGYPDGLKGEAIPVGARIIAVVDAFNAMTTNRPYRRAMTRAQALEELRQCAGKQFDPQIVQVFVRLVDVEKET